MLHTVDAEKVAAAGSTLAAIRKDLNRLGTMSNDESPGSLLPGRHLPFPRKLCGHAPLRTIIAAKLWQATLAQSMTKGCCRPAGAMSWTRSARWRSSTSTLLHSQRRCAPPHSVAMMIADMCRCAVDMSHMRCNQHDGPGSRVYLGVCAAVQKHAPVLCS